MLVVSSELRKVSIVLKMILFCCIRISLSDLIWLGLKRSAGVNIVFSALYLWACYKLPQSWSVNKTVSICNANKTTSCIVPKLYVQAFFGAAGVCVCVCVCRLNHTAGDAEVRIQNNAARSGPAFLQHTHKRHVLFIKIHTHTSSYTHTQAAVFPPVLSVFCLSVWKMHVMHGWKILDIQARFQWAECKSLC